MPYDEVVPGLFIGPKPSPGRRRADVDVIVLAAMEYQPPAVLFPGVEVIYAPLDDDSSRAMTANEIATAIKAGRRVARRLRAGRRVLSTCAMGLNRSSLIAALAMSEIYGMSADEIIRRIRRARGMWALSNPNFERLLRVAIEMRRGKDDRRSSASE
jgi:protein-tyrosine phosphatase